MKKIKSPNSFLKNQTRKNLAKAALCIIIFGLIFFATALRILLSLNIGVLEVAGLVASFVFLAGFYFYNHKYRIYNGGYEGEKAVTTILSQNLNDDYYLINHVYLGNGGDIDHVLLGPSGIFVLETKNWNGKIICNGDEWQRPGKHDVGSPSRQVKRNTQKIRQLIDSSASMPKNIQIEGAIIFANKNAKLELKNPTTKIVKIKNLPSLIKSQERNKLYQAHQLEEFGKLILKQSKIAILLS